MESILCKAIDLREGDYVDLEGDPFADPRRDSAYFRYEYAMVNGVDIETPTCVCVWIDGVDAFGFPPDHIIKRVML
jgi:hypothetical protein